MGFRNREVESKLIVFGRTLDEANVLLRGMFEAEIDKSLFGSSVDTYWHLRGDTEGDFIRMRERDGIRQLTVKAQDRDTPLDRLEIDVDVTSDTSTLRRLLVAAHGREARTISKTYYVYWLDKHTTACVYQVTDPSYPHVFLEVETTSRDKLLELESKVLTELGRQGIVAERAPGSLYQMFVARDRPMLPGVS